MSYNKCISVSAEDLEYMRVKGLSATKCLRIYLKYLQDGRDFGEIFRKLRKLAMINERCRAALCLAGLENEYFKAIKDSEGENDN